MELNDKQIPQIPSENTYPTTSLTELNRLQEQDTYTNRRTLLRSATPERPGLALLPPEFPEKNATILDVGCGSGGWCLEIAYSCPELRVIGLDIDKKKVEFSKNQAIALGIKNVEFLEGDMLKLSENIPPESVDLLHARYLEWFVKDYGALLKQWINALKTGGVLVVTESEGSVTTSQAYNKIQRTFFEALENTHGKGRIDESRQGKTLHMYHQLLELGMHHVQEIAHVLNFGARTPDREYLVRANCSGFVSMKPFIVQSGKIAADEYDRLAEEATRDLWHESFRGNQFILTVTGIKP